MAHVRFQCRISPAGNPAGPPGVRPDLALRTDGLVARLRAQRGIGPFRPGRAEAQRLLLRCKCTRALSAWTRGHAARDHARCYAACDGVAWTPGLHPFTGRLSIPVHCVSTSRLGGGGGLPGQSKTRSRRVRGSQPHRRGSLGSSGRARFVAAGIAGHLFLDLQMGDSTASQGDWDFGFSVSVQPVGRLTVKPRTIVLNSRWRRSTRPRWRPPGNGWAASGRRCG